MTVLGLNPHCMKLSGSKISWLYFLSLPLFLSGEYSRRTVLYYKCVFSLAVKYYLEHIHINICMSYPPTPVTTN